MINLRYHFRKIEDAHWKRLVGGKDLPIPGLTRNYLQCPRRVGSETKWEMLFRTLPEPIVGLGEAALRKP